MKGKAADIIPPVGRHREGGSSKTNHGQSTVTRKPQGAAKRKHIPKSKKDKMASARVEGDLKGLNGRALIKFVQEQADVNYTEAKTMVMKWNGFISDDPLLKNP
jgi:hypothetical protein